MKLGIKIAFLTFILFEYGCLSGKSEVENYKDAHLVKIDSIYYLELRGKRVLLHDNGAYEDTELISIPRLSGRIEGKEIAVKKGYYDYQGYILIDSNALTIDLLINNTDDKVLSSFSWNGDYRLIK